MTDETEVKTAGDFQGVFRGGDGATLTVDDAEPPDPVNLAQATALARRTLASQLQDGGTVGEASPATLDGEPARRFEGRQGDRTVLVQIAMHDGKTWTLTLNGPSAGFTASILEEAAASWKWD